MGRKKKSPTTTRPKKTSSAQKPVSAEPPPFHNPFLQAADRLKAALKKPAPPKPPPASQTAPPASRTAPPVSPGRSTPAGGNTNADLEAFVREMAGVKPLVSPQPRKRKASMPRRVRPVPDDDAEVLAQLADLVAGDAPFDIADTAEYVQGIVGGLDPKLLDRLKRGDFSVQSHLDLHGMTWEEAKTAVSGFLHRAQLDSLRCVLVVHGRGHHSRDKEPVLKNQLVRWMTRSAVARTILAFCSAQPHDGGAGALYLLLRR